jgi:hypothetical protein
MRVYGSYQYFLNETTARWYHRAIDDGWIHPDNIFEVIDHFETFLNPDTDIVMKGCKTRNRDYACGPWLEGGAGWLMSRAAVMHAVSYDYDRLCSTVCRMQDDTINGLVFCHTFPDARYWDFPLLTGNPFSRNHPANYAANLSLVTANCYRGAIFPFRKLIAFHTAGRPALIALVRNISTAPLDLAFESIRRIFRLCRVPKERLVGIGNLEWLKRWTPIVKYRKGGEEIPWSVSQSAGTAECRQCVGLMEWEGKLEPSRLEAWNRTGWQKYYHG